MFRNCNSKTVPLLRKQRQPVLWEPAEGKRYPPFPILARVLELKPPATPEEHPASTARQAWQAADGSVNDGVSESSAVGRTAHPDVKNAVPVRLPISRLCLAML